MSCRACRLAAATRACRFPLDRANVSTRCARLFASSYRAGMQFPDSTLAALDLRMDEPLHWSRVLLVAMVVTIAAVSAALLI